MREGAAARAPAGRARGRAGRGLPLGRLPALLLLGLWAASARGAPDAPPALPGAAVRLGPLPEGWAVERREPAPGQAVLHLRAPGGAAFVEARCFPAEPLAGPLRATLQRAVGHWFRTAHGLGGPAAGLLDLREVAVLGRPAAEAGVSTAWQGRAAAGHARLLRASAHQWVLALGVAPRTDAATLALVEAFVAGLEPEVPAFYEPTFHAGEAFAEVVARGPDGAPVTGSDLRAVGAAIEAALGARVALAQRPYLEAALRADLAAGGPAAARGYLAVGAFVRAFEGDPEALAAGLADLGRRMVAALERRASGERYAPAVQLLLVLDRLSRVVVGTRADGLDQARAGAALEARAFFASLALDGPQQVSEAERAAWLAALAARWDGLTPEARAAWRASDRHWSALRRAFDGARPEARRALRRALAAALYPGPEGAPPRPPEAPRALRLWLDARPEAERAAARARALALEPAAFAALCAALGLGADDLARDAYHHGW